MTSETPNDDEPEPEDAGALEKSIWGMGGFGENIANNALPSMANAIYQIGYGINPVMLGWALAASRIFDAFIDPFVGNWSDNTRSRFGRRRPFVVVGAILLAVTFALLWLPPTQFGPTGITIYLSIAAFFFYTAFAVFIIPFSALGLEMVGSYDGRTRLFIFRLVPAFAGSLLVPALYYFARSDVFGNNELVGMRYIGLIIAGVILLTALPAGLFCKERHATTNPGKIRLLPAFRATVSNRPFVILLGAVFLTFFGLFCGVIIYSNMNIYYVCSGEKDLAGKIGMHVGLIKGLGELAMLPLLALAAARFQKHRLAMLGLGLSAIGYLVSYPAFTPDKPYLQLAAFLPANLGLCACWLLNGSMIADICDADQLVTGSRREGMFSAVFAVVYKGGIASGALFGNYLLSWCGAMGESDRGADIVSLPAAVIANIRLAYMIPPAICFAGAAGCMLAYPLTRRKMAEIRRQLQELKSVKSSLNP